jgi:hypothetical protein
LFGLPPGTYVIQAFPGRREAGFLVLSAADVDAALAAPLPPRSPLGSLLLPEPTVGRSVMLAPIYFPGTPLLDQATRVTVAVGEERSAVDFVMDHIPALRVEGTVVRRDGAPSANARVELSASGASGDRSAQQTSTTGPEGAFSFDAVPPGAYRLTAVDSNPGAGVPAVATASTAVDVGADVTGVSLVLGPTVALEATLVPDADVSGGDFTSLHLRLLALTGPERPAIDVAVDTKGVAIFRALEPGRYRLAVRAPGTGTRNLADPTPYAVVIAGEDVIDRPFEITGREAVVEAAIRMGHRAASLQGRLQSGVATGAASPTLLLFPADRSRWFWDSRWIHIARPFSDGRYAFPALPPGDYFLAAVSDVAENEWFDPAFLQPLADQAVSLRLAEGERRTQDFTVPQPVR